MNKKIFDYICKCEGWKTAIKSLHWNSNSLSQHELCDDIASLISDFQDLVSEVEQSMSGKLPFNKLRGTEYKITSLKKFVNDVISDSKRFLRELEGMGENYVGVKSECETFISDMQRKLYLVNFTLKEEAKARIAKMINERMYKNVPNIDDKGNYNFDKMKGRKPSTAKTRINHIKSLISKYGLESRKYDTPNKALYDYKKTIESLGCNVSIKNSDVNEYKIYIKFDDGMTIDGYVKAMCGDNGCKMTMALYPSSVEESVLSNNIDRIISESINRMFKRLSYGFQDVDV